MRGQRGHSPSFTFGRAQDVRNRMVSPPRGGGGHCSQFQELPVRFTGQPRYMEETFASERRNRTDAAHQSVARYADGVPLRRCSTEQMSPRNRTPPPSPPHPGRAVHGERGSQQTSRSIRQSYARPPSPPRRSIDESNADQRSGSVTPQQLHRTAFDMVATPRLRPAPWSSQSACKKPTEHENENPEALRSKGSVTPPTLNRAVLDASANATLRSRTASSAQNVSKRAASQSGDLEADIRTLFTLFHSPQRSSETVLDADDFARAQNLLADMAVEAEFQKAMKFIDGLGSFGQKPTVENTYGDSKWSAVDTPSSAVATPRSNGTSTPRGGTRELVTKLRSSRGSETKSMRPSGVFRQQSMPSPDALAQLRIGPVPFLPIPRIRSPSIEVARTPRQHTSCDLHTNSSTHSVASSRNRVRSVDTPTHSLSGSLTQTRTPPGSSRSSRTPPPPNPADAAAGHTALDFGKNTSRRSQSPPLPDSPVEKPATVARVATTSLECNPPYLEAICTTSLRDVTNKLVGKSDDSIDFANFREWQMQTLDVIAPTDAARSDLLAQAVQHMQIARDRVEYREILEKATTIAALQEALVAARHTLRPRDLEQYSGKLKQMQDPYVLYITSLASDRHEVLVSRTHIVRSLRETASAHFKVDLYRIALCYLEKPLGPDEATLENCGLITGGAEIAAIIKEDEPWRDLYLLDFFERLVQHNLASREEANAMQRQVLSGAAEEKTCRALYFPRIRALEAREGSEKARAEAQAEEMSRWRAEALEQERRIAQLKHDTALPQRLDSVKDMSTEDLLAEAVFAGLVPEETASHVSAPYVFGTSWRHELVQHVACHRSIALWKAEERRLPGFARSGDTASQTDVWKFEELRRTAEEDLESLLPSLRASEQVMNTFLNKQDICEIRAFNQPPHAVMKVVEALCSLLGIQLRGDTVARWQMAKSIMHRDSQFGLKLLAIERDAVHTDVIRRLEKIVSSEELNPESLRRINESAMRLSTWMRAMVTYHRAASSVRQRRATLSKVEGYLQAHSAAEESQLTHVSQTRESLARLQSELARLSPLPRLIDVPAQEEQHASVADQSSIVADVLAANKACSEALDRVSSSGNVSA